MPDPNPENGGFLKNWAKPSTVTATVQDTDFEISKAFRFDPNETFCASASAVTINLTYSSPREITGIAFINHNLTPASNSFIRFFETEFTGEPDVELSIPFATKNTYLIIDPGLVYNKIQLYIEDQSLEMIQVGVIYPGESYQFPYNYSWDYEVEFSVVKEVEVTDCGLVIETPSEDDTDPVPEMTKYRISFSDIDRNFEDIKALIRRGKKVFIPDFTVNECHFGTVPDFSITSRNTYEAEEYSISFWEDAIGEF